MPSAREQFVRRLHDLIAREGPDAMFDVVPPASRWSPLAAEGREFSAEEARAWFKEQRADGSRAEPVIVEMQEHGDALLVVGSVQIHARDARHEYQPVWIYRFDGDELLSARGYPSRSAALAALR